MTFLFLCSLKGKKKKSYCPFKITITDTRPKRYIYFSYLSLKIVTTSLVHFIYVKFTFVNSDSKWPLYCLFNSYDTINIPFGIILPCIEVPGRKVYVINMCNLHIFIPHTYCKRQTFTFMFYDTLKITRLIYFSYRIVL